MRVDRELVTRALYWNVQRGWTKRLIVKADHIVWLTVTTGATKKIFFDKNKAQKLGIKNGKDI